MKKFLTLLAVVLLLQGCTVLNAKRDYQGMSRALAFNQNKKWLINNMYTDLSASAREKTQKRIFETFSSLSKGNSFTLTEARQQNLLASKISFSPTLEELESLKENSDFDFLVTASTKQVSDQIGAIEYEKPIQYSKNEAFAILEVYDIKTMKRIYFQKATLADSRDARKTYPEYSGEEILRDEQNKKDRDLKFTHSAEQLSMIGMKKILKDIKKHAVK
ncbi:MAG: hypothetical protein QM564_02685 [Bergeyella sp.]